MNYDVRSVADERITALASLRFSTTDMTMVLEQVTRTATDLMPASLGSSLILWDPDGESYVTAASTVPEQDIGATTTAVRRRAGATRWIIDNRAPLVVEDTADHPLGDGGLVDDFGIRSFVGAPVGDDEREEEAKNLGDDQLLTETELPDGNVAKVYETERAMSGQM